MILLLTVRSPDFQCSNGSKWLKIGYKMGLKSLFIYLQILIYTHIYKSEADLEWLSKPESHYQASALLVLGTWTIFRPVILTQMHKIDGSEWKWMKREKGSTNSGFFFSITIKEHLPFFTPFLPLCCLVINMLILFSSVFVSHLTRL